MQAPRFRFLPVLGSNPTGPTSPQTVRLFLAIPPNQTQPKPIFLPIAVVSVFVQSFNFELAYTLIARTCQALD
jgi:hypothetical protein